MRKIVILNIIGILSVVCLCTTSVFAIFGEYNTSSYMVGCITFILSIYGCAALAHINAEYESKKHGEEV